LELRAVPGCWGGTWEGRGAASAAGVEAGDQKEEAESVLGGRRTAGSDLRAVGGWVGE
jgi:hypothetical protein